jgi:hypothetical protein
MEFLLSVMPARSSSVSASPPEIPSEPNTSASMRWLSVPPVMRRTPPACEYLRHGLRVRDHLVRVRLERGLRRLMEADCLRGYLMHVRAALEAGNTLRSMSVGRFSMVFSGALSGIADGALRKDHRAARTAQRLVRRGRHDLEAVVERILRAPPAMSPAMCATSAIATASTSRAIAAMRSQSSSRG